MGNHTGSHRRLEELSQEEIVQEIGKTDALLCSLLGEDNYWVRPPYGLLRPGTEGLIPVPMVKWSVDPRDWESRDTGKVIQAVEEAIRPNSIILLHDIYPTSVDAALALIDRLRGEGYEFLTVSELMDRNGVSVKNGVLYRDGNGA